VPEITTTTTIPTIDVSVSGYALLADPLLNKGTAFNEAEREEFDLHGLLPPHVGTLDEQVARRIEGLRNLSNDLERFVFLRGLQDTNESLYYALVTREITELLPLIYTPTVGLGCQRFSQVYTKPRGLFLSYPNRDRIEAIFASSRYDKITTIVVTDGERILGLGDQGAGGMGIPIGKLAIYTACAGIDPATTLPIMLDVGTDNIALRDDPLYIGWRNERITGQAYDDFIEIFVSAVQKRWPHVLLQWEDFARHNATRLLERYRDRLCTFNDDVQGTAAVATGTLLSALAKSGTTLNDERIAVLGAGGAGCGISNLLLRAMIEAGVPADEARRRFYLIDRDGLLTDDMAGLMPFQQPFAQPRGAVTGWTLERPGRIELFDVMRNVKPTVLIGVTGVAGAFTEAAIREMARGVDRPIVMPLSNPTSCAEATPADLARWTEGRAIVGVGSPFPAVQWNGHSHPVDQTNNVYIFPGLGLGVVAAKIRRISDGMFLAAAKALAELSPSRTDPDGRLLPPLTSVRDVSFHVARAVALQAMAEGLADARSPAALDAAIRETMWSPVYHPYRRVR
jgi:malate dehydrogenase (oxaloacetate-decarboxylating)